MEEGKDENERLEDFMFAFLDHLSIHLDIRVSQI